MGAGNGTEGAGLVRNESLRRGLLVLRTLARAEEPLSAAEVARRTGIPSPTVQRLLATLADEAMAIRDQDTGWTTGPAVVELAATDAATSALVARAQAVLRSLSNAVGESVLLTRVLLPDRVEVLVQQDADRLLGATRWVGRVFDLRCSVAGWVVGASLGAAEASALGGRDRAIRARWVEQVELTRQRGYALDVEGLEPGLTSLAVLVPRAEVRMTIGTAGPSSRLTPERAVEIARLLRRAAQTLALTE